MINREHTDLAIGLGINQEKLSELDILFLHENYGAEKMVDPSETLDLYKTFKESGLKCANSYELELESEIITRRGNEIWLGQMFRNLFTSEEVNFCIGLMQQYNITFN